MVDVLRHVHPYMSAEVAMNTNQEVGLRARRSNIIRHGGAMAGLDELDKAILRELQADARRTNRDIAAAVGVSASTALERTRSLRQRGVIRGTVLDLNLA